MSEHEAIPTSLDEITAAIFAQRWVWALGPVQTGEMTGDRGLFAIEWEATVTTTRGDVEYRHQTPIGALAGAYKRAMALPR